MKIKKTIASLCLILGTINTFNFVAYTLKNDSPINREDIKRFKS
ncbi:MAG: hypothetical protein ACRC7N_06940 [Clostridium sp.]